MNKLTKGAVAGVAGIALLLGGAGTFATWNASANVEGASSITAGTLSISGANPSQWTSNGTKVADINKYAIVPGDTLVYTKTLDIVATGDNLAATLSFSPGSVTPNDASNKADVALHDLLLAKGNASLVISGAGVKDNGDGTYGIAKGTTAVTLTATLICPKSADNSIMNGKVNLSALSATLQQK